MCLPPCNSKHLENRYQKQLSDYQQRKIILWKKPTLFIFSRFKRVYLLEDGQVPSVSHQQSLCRFCISDFVIALVLTMVCAAQQELRHAELISTNARLLEVQKPLCC